MQGGLPCVTQGTLPLTVGFRENGLTSLLLIISLFYEMRLIFTPHRSDMKIKDDNPSGYKTASCLKGNEYPVHVSSSLFVLFMSL